MLVYIHATLEFLSKRDKNNYIKIAKNKGANTDKESRRLFNKVNYLTKEFTSQTQTLTITTLRA